LIIVKIIGGLGNQIFQYAYAKSLQQKGYIVKLDISSFKKYKLHGGYFLDRYLIDIGIASQEELRRYGDQGFFSVLRKKIRFVNSKSLVEESFFFNNELMFPRDNSYIEGYFQSERYFQEIRSVILLQISLKKKLSEYSSQIESQIKKCKISCSIHIRRGDYLTDNTTNKVHGVLGLDYYKRATKLLENKGISPQYYVFSDDIKWAEDNLDIKNLIFIKSPKQRVPNEDIYLMSLCNHNIIANSTFSWWGAWLNQNRDKVVISPLQWFLDDGMNKDTFDLIPPVWLRI